MKQELLVAVLGVPQHDCQYLISEMPVPNLLQTVS